MALEDSAALGECIARCENVRDLPRVLEVFEKVRKERTEWLAAYARRRKDWYILPDGEMQRERDQRMKGMVQPVWDGKVIASPPDIATAGPNAEHYIRAYDVFTDVSRAFSFFFLSLILRESECLC